MTSSDLDFVTTPRLLVRPPVEADRARFAELFGNADFMVFYPAVEAGTGRRRHTQPLHPSCRPAGPVDHVSRITVNSSRSCGECSSMSRGLRTAAHFGGAVHGRTTARQLVQSSSPARPRKVGRPMFICLCEGSPKRVSF